MSNRPGIDDAPLDLPSTNIVDVLRFRSNLHPDASVFTFLPDGELATEQISYVELDLHARAIGAWLRQRNAAGKPVLLLHAPGIQFITSFFGCLYAGAIAVPAYPPRLNGKLTRLQSIAIDSQATHVLTDTSSVDRLKPIAAQIDGLKQVEWLDNNDAVNRARELCDEWQPPAIDDHTLAFLQYTSGSTGQPKGVMVTHRNLLHNQSLIKIAFRHAERGCVVGWLPLYHDMGLIGNVMHTIYTGSSSVLMSPVAFIQRPVRWLETITRYQGGISGGPSFAYDLCVRKVSAEQRATLDLSSWRIAFNGAEPVRADVLDRFADTFESCGFRREAFHPCYGLAEATLITTGRSATAPPVTQTISASLLEQQLAITTEADETNTRTFVGCGNDLNEQEVIIVDPETRRRCAPDGVGEIWVRGPSVAAGYWNKPELTAETFDARLESGDGPFLRTGDLGFINDGELYVTGRLKDLIIINGRNHYPQDVERTIEQSYPGIRAGSVVAVAVDVDGEERLATFVEIERTSLRSLNATDVEHAVRTAVGESHELDVHAILLLKPGTIPKTTSGKLQRRQCVKMFLAGEFADVLAQRAPAVQTPKPSASPHDRPIQFSLLYFSSNEADFSDNKYELLIEGAKFADQHDFTAVWVPERHFHAFGGLYPNPSVLGSALAMVTRRIRIRAGSVVLPLHNPVRVAEEWSVVDNLSQGRVDLAFARGWNPNDFVFAPQNYANSTEILFNEMQTVRRLWQGETVKLPNGTGKETEIRIHPLPKQRELAFWVTCSGGAERFKEAGACGANVLTALLFQSVEELAEKIVAYREARAQHGHDPAAGHITLMLHTFVDDKMDTVRQTVREPFIEYLKTSVSLWRHGSKDLHDLTPKQQEELLAFAFERYFQKTALFGTPASCLATVKRLQGIGVNEIACLIDFGVDTKRVLLSLEALDLVRVEAQAKPRKKQDEHRSLSEKVSVPITEDRDRVRRLQDVIVAHIARSLGIDAQKVPLDRNFYSLGVSSLKAIEIMEGLSLELGVSLSPTVLFEAPTVTELAKYFARTQPSEVCGRNKEDAVRDTDVAVIGMSCRFPQAPSIDAFWKLLREGRDAVTEVPLDHWDWRLVYDKDQSNGKKTYSRWGGFLDGIDQFDPFFFNISHREARLMDPQQRIFLEVSWETFEHAGYSVESLAGKQVGVFVGSSNNGYYHHIAHSLTAADHAAGVGNQQAIIANRVSFTLNLRGPSLLIDTMCSSSLVALHTALQSLRNGECELALAGGVNILLSPEYYVAMSRMKAHSPDGHCKTFDHRADGIVFGEGAGAVLLKPLRQALRDGDAIYAVIKGSAVNHGGQTNGLTAPNPDAQAQLINRALEQAGVSADSISYLEAHGTGTSLGDPIEIEGASRAFRTHTDRKQFCAIGSVKTNIGHLEPAAGISGLIKVILAMQHRELPPTLNFEKPNPIIDFAESPFRVNTELRPWNGSAVRRAGISSFGIGGTNAHVVLEEAPHATANVNENERPLHVLTLSAKSEHALKNLAERYIDFLLSHPQIALADVCFTANVGRSHFSHRIAVSAESTEHLVGQLKAFVAGAQTHYGVTQTGKAPRVAFLSTGLGAQVAGMGHELFLTQPIFRNALSRCDGVLREYLEQPFLSVLYPEKEQASELIQHAAYAEPALFALEYSVLTLWRAWGVAPEIVLGHSVGEYAAACAAGVFSVEEGLRLISGRARMSPALPNGGEMAAVFAPEPRVLEAIKACGNDVSVAAVNAPEQVVISGRCERVARVLEHFEQRGVRTQRFQVQFANGVESLAQENVKLLPSLKPGSGDWRQLLDGLCELYVAGVEINWRAFDADYQRRRVALPTYPFERERCWIDAPQNATSESIPVSPISAPSNLDEWFYEIQWRREEPQRQPEITTSSSWIVLADEQGVGESLAQALEKRGETCFVVRAAQAFTRRGSRNFTIDPAADADFDRLLEECEGAKALRGIVQLWSLDADVDSGSTDSASLVRLVQSLERRTKSHAAPSIWVVTSGNQSVGSLAQVPAVAQAPIWGLGRVLSLERPQLWGGLIDLDPATSATDQADQIIVQILAGDHEDQVVFRGGDRYVPRLVQSDPTTTTPLVLQSDATYLITGGLGSLGLRVAQWLIDHGAHHLVLISRRPQHSPAIAALEARGAEIQIISADVADEARMSAVFEELKQSAPPLRGIVHAAGVQTRQSISEMDLQQFEAVLRPKVLGGWTLHKLTATMELDFFVCFSSMSSVLGSVDLAHYAAANQFLDALAHHRRASGLPGLSVNWGPWSGDGMVTSEIAGSFERLGVKPLPAERAVAALETLLQSGSAQVIVADIDWQTFKPIYESRRRRPLLDEIIIAKPEAAPVATAEPSELALELTAMPERERHQLLRTHISTEVAQILGRESSHLPKNAGFFELGMDSLMAMELKRRLEASLGCTLAPTLTFDYPNIDSLVQHILDHVLALNGNVHSTEWLRAQSAEQVLATVEELSDEEALVLLEEKLKVLEGNM